MLQVLSCPMYIHPWLPRLSGGGEDGHGPQSKEMVLASWQVSCGYLTYLLGLPVDEPLAPLLEGQWRNRGWNSKLWILLFVNDCAAQKFMGEGFRTFLGSVDLAPAFHLCRLPPSLSSPAITERGSLFPGLEGSSLSESGIWNGFVPRSCYRLVHSSPSIIPQFPWAVNLPYVWKRASEGRDQKPQVFFHVFIFSSPAPDLLLEGAGLESDRVGSRPDCGHPAEATELLTWMGQDRRAALQRNPLKCKHFLSWKEGKLKWKPIVLCRQCSLGSKREWGL